MANNQSEKEIIKALSKRVVEAQAKILILDSIKWDDSVQKEFFKNKCKELPKVDAQYYKDRPLAFNADDKIDEFRGILRDTHNQLGQYSSVSRLIQRQCEEYTRAIRMLKARGTDDFSEYAMELYGSPEDVFYAHGPRLSELGSLLFDVLTTLEVKLKSEADEDRYSPQEAQKILQARLDTFFTKHPGQVKVEVSDDLVADAAAGADKIKLNHSVKFSDRDLKYLEVHEGWVHVGTTFNGSLQPYCSFLSKGAPSCAVLQEGLAVLTEIVTFSSNPARLRKITNRVIALDKIVKGADFLDIYHYLVSCGLSEQNSYLQAVRVFRGSTPTGGPFTKDLSYAKGFVLSYNFLCFAIAERRIDLIPLLFAGKLRLEDIPLLVAVRDEGFLEEPTYLPPQFRDLAALSSWLSFSLYLTKFDMKEVQENFQFLLGGGNGK